ncbi:MAG TPA: extracellular solute-binding protein, partial [Symbiobacteriaceae bacterium]
SSAGKPDPKDQTGTSASGTVVVYSGRSEHLVQPIFDQFTQETGIKVEVRYGSSPELANLVREERANPQADIYIGNDAGAMELLRRDGLLAPHDFPGLEQVPPDLRAEDGSWVGVTVRLRVIMYNTELLPNPEELPRSIFDLADPKWKGQIAMNRAHHEYMVGNITALRLAAGEERTEQFLRDLLKNEPVALGSDTQIRQSVGKGEFALGWVNHYYYFLEKAEGSPVGIIWPDQEEGGIGAAVNTTGVALIKGGPNPENGKRFIEFMLRPDIQELLAQRNYEIPTLAGVKPAEGVPTLDQIKRTQVDLKVYGEEWSRTVDLIERIGLP